MSDTQSYNLVTDSIGELTTVEMALEDRIERLKRDKVRLAEFSGVIVACERELKFAEDLLAKVTALIGADLDARSEGPKP